LYDIWQEKAIYPHLIGSVIPFIRLREMSDLSKTGLEKLTINPEKVRKNISKIVQMEKHQVNIQKQIDLIKQMKRAFIFEVLEKCLFVISKPTCFYR
jgi:short-subunit dehydrogenase